MRILLIRHGIAEDQKKFATTGREDDLRPLTGEGRKKMRQASKGLTELQSEISVLATSPLRRAVETGKIVAREYKTIEPVQIPQLSPRKPLQGLLTWVQSQKAEAVVALVGHEPHLSTFAAWLMTGLQESFIELKKGGAALIEMPDEIKPGHGKLLWSLKPSHLRALGKQR
jgi:phosphohistidine phosphatase